MACENKYSTLLDLARQAKIISGNTACLEGKAQFGIPFSGYPTGPDLSTLSGTGVVSSATAVFSGNSGTTLFDVSNSASTNYNAVFSGYSATTWAGFPILSANTSGLTLPITPFSADNQTVGPILFLAETGMTGDHIIATLYTGYTIEYSFFEVAGESMDLPPFYSGVTGFTTAVQTNLSAGTLDYKGPLDYVSSKEDLTVENRLTTNKLTVTDGASASTIGYVLTQLDEAGKAGWVFNSSTASTNTFVTGGTLTGTNLDLTWNTGGSVPSIELSGLTGTSGGITLDPYNNVGSATTATSLTWDVSGTSTNYEVTLTGNTELLLTNVRNGDYGTLIVHQDATGGRTLEFNSGFGPHYVVNGGGASLTLTATGNARDIISFTYNGTAAYWTVGNDYT